MLLKTPFRLIHFPGVALAVAGAALVLAAVTVSTRLFLPAAGDAALQQDLGQIGGVPALFVVMFSPIGPNELAALSRQVEGVVAGRVPRLGEPVRTVLGPPVQVAPAEGSGEPQGGAPVERVAPVQLAARDGFAGHVRRLATAPGTAAADGVWLPESVATALRLRPGQAVTVGAAPRARTRVAGIYQDLTGGDRPLDPFWSPLSGALAVRKVGEEPPPLLLAEPALLAELGRQLGASARLEWNYYLPPGRLTVPTVETLVPQIDRVRLDVSDPVSVLAARQATASSPLANAVASAHATEVALTGPVETISVTGRILALALLAAAGLYGVKRRRGEVLLLTAQGVGGAQLAARSVVEAALPLLAGGLAGLAARGAGRLLAGGTRPLRGGGRPRPAVFLAVRRLAAAPRLVLLLVTGSALAIGILGYAGILVASTRAAAHDKARILVGSDASVTTRAPAKGLDGSGLAATRVQRVSGATLDADPAVVGRVPALLAGPAVPTSNAIEVGGADLPIAIVGSASAFPGMSRADRPLLVVSAARLSVWAENARTPLAAEHEVWTREDPAAIVAVLREAGTVPEATRTASTVMRTPAFLAVSWTFAMLQALGALAGLVALI